MKISIAAVSVAFLAASSAISQTTDEQTIAKVSKHAMVESWIASAPSSVLKVTTGWPQQKNDYVVNRLSSGTFYKTIENAEREADVTLDPSVRLGLAIEYAGTEYDLQQSSFGLMLEAGTQKDVLKRYFISGFSSASGATSSGPESTEGFVFNTSQPNIAVFARTTPVYGKLKINLNPPADTFTVVVNKNVYDSEDTLILLTGSYIVVVERPGDKCGGRVTIRENRTSMFACR